MTTTLKMAVTATATSRWFISISWQGGAAKLPAAAICKYFLQDMMDDLLLRPMDDRHVDVAKSADFYLKKYKNICSK